MSSLFSKRLLSTTASTIQMRPQPSKSHHHHVTLPASSFPKGFLVGGTFSGIKKKKQDPSVLDLAVILSTSSCETSAAACFTRNAFKAAPVVVSDEILKRSGGYARGVVVNSGCANAVTGKQGMEDAWVMVRETDKVLSDLVGREFENECLVMSTGVIGVNLPISKIVDGIRSFVPSSTPTPTPTSGHLGSDFSSWERAAKAFMTTDTFPKLRSRVFTIRGVQYRMAGVDKGAGMIHPDMGPASTSFSSPTHATLLGCIVTDAAVSPRSLQNALTYAVDRSFNSISVDGDMSTNDSVYVLANGAAIIGADGAECRVIDEERDKEAYETFRDELTTFAQDLAKLVVRDGEGATKFVTVTVKNAPTYRDAHNIASRVSTSALVKTALYGEDANWGRILAATGSVPLLPPSVSSSSSPSAAVAVIDPTKVSVTFVPADGSSPLPVLVKGEPEAVDESRAKEILQEEEFEVEIDLGLVGTTDGEARYWTCDFSYEYVRINGDYRT